jgi:endoglucanase
MLINQLLGLSAAIRARSRMTRPARPRPAAIALGITLGLGLAEAQRPVDRYGQLKVQGNKIVDKNGQPVILRGMSLYWSQWQAGFYNANVVKWLAEDWKCSIVRASMAVEEGGYLTKPDEEKNKIKAVVQAAIDNGIYVLIDWHDHNAVSHSQQARSFFEEMARTYGNHPNVLYEPYNEPLNTHNWAGQIKPYHEGVISAIRAHDPDNIIICGTKTWSQDVDEASRNPIAGTNIAYTLHFYAASHKQFLRDKAKTALNNGVALFVTEYGTTEASGGGAFDEAETRRWWDFLDQNHIGHCNWSIAAITETSAALRPGSSTQGGWNDGNLSNSGAFVRAEIRSKNSATTGLARQAPKPADRARILPAAQGWHWGGDAGDGRVTGYRDARGRLLTIRPVP